MAQQRFSKQALTEYIQQRVNSIQNDWGFDPDNGYAQVNAVAIDRLRTNPIDPREDWRTAAVRRRDALARDPGFLQRALEATKEEAQRAYGLFEELRRLADEFDLPVTLVHEGLVLTRTKGSGRVKRFRPRVEVV